MKFFSLATACAVVAVATATLATRTLVHAQAATQVAATTSMQEALDAAKGTNMPVGVIFTGTVEALDTDANVNTDADDHDENHESFGYGHHGFGYGRHGRHGYGGWGRFGPHRLGYRCGGIGGWAYPLGYWNAVGAGLYGGGCGLGLAAGGLFYC